jgi:hypothetical protein
MKTAMMTLLGLALIGNFCAHLEAAQMPREEYIRRYTKTGGVLSREKFVDPPIEARGNPFWPIPNGYFDLGQITRELEEMKDKGLAGAAYWDTGPQKTSGRRAGGACLDGARIHQCHCACDKRSGATRSGNVRRAGQQLDGRRQLGETRKCGQTVVYL